MTKLSEKLANLGQTEPGRLGFGPRQSRQKTPSILIVGYSKDGTDAGAQFADVLIVSADAARSPEFKATGEKVSWGVSFTTTTAEELDAVKEAGAQFVLIESYDAPAAALRDDDMDRGLVVHGAPSDRQSSALNDSKFEFLVYDAREQTWPLTVGRALDLQEQVSLYSKHMFLWVVSLPTADDLEPLRDMPVSAIVVDLSKVSTDELEELHKRISALEPRKPRDSSVALVPSNRSNGSAAEDDGDYDDDWDDDDY